MQDSDVDKLLERMDQLEGKVDHVLEKVDPNAKNDMNKASKPTMALALGAAGAKVGFLLGAKTGWLAKLLHRSYETDFKTALKEGFFIPDFSPEAHENNQDNLFNQSKALVIGSAIGTIVLGSAAAGLGWYRGERLEHAFDLIQHPIDSMNRLIISDKQFAEQYPSHAKLLQKWQEKIDISQNDKNQSIGISAKT